MQKGHRSLHGVVMKYKQQIKDMPVDTSWSYEEDREWFIKEISDLAFGENTIERGYSMEEVVMRLKKYSDFSLKWEEHSGEESC